MAAKKFRQDYKPLEYHIEHTDLTIVLDPHETLVTNQMQVRRTEHGSVDSPLVLDGTKLELVDVAINGEKLKPNEYALTEENLTIFSLPKECTVTIRNKIDPTANKSCQGLYRSEGIYTTQCESENFRKITFFQDRPDNLATYTTTVIGDQQQNPLLLSNGNLVKQEILDNGKHLCVFDDPIPKPSYLFALVAGNLRTVKDYTFTKDGKKIDLNIHVKGDKFIKTAHAMHSLKAAFAWDEEKYGLPYDLDVYNIVGVPDFNAGAMENKGLNIFNDDSLLVSPQTSTDHDFEWIYTVVSHEFFHNYAGNRVTIRNWFELALKEGLATQKEREFLADQIGYTEPRINNVRTLRAVQFPEDNGATAHPVRNDSYEDISNFYTTTTYYKGSELLSMLSGLLGQDLWRQGVKAYFQRLDGTAATIDDFLTILGEVSGRDLSQFKRWYEQAGTPRLHISEQYDPANETYTLTIKQTCPPTPGQEYKLPFHIPIKMGLLDQSGNDLPLKLLDEKNPQGTTRVLELTETEQSFTFTGIKQKPTPSLLRDFSAPVIVEQSVLNNNDLIFLMAHDSNAFNRWDAAQQLHQRVILGLVEDIQAQRSLKLDQRYIDASYQVLTDKSLAPGMIAEILSLTSTSELLEKMRVFDPQALDQAKHFIRKTLAQEFRPELEQLYQSCQQDCKDHYTPEYAGKRKLKNMVLDRLMILGAEETHNPYAQWAHDQFLRTQNMTDRLGALGAVHCQNQSTMLPTVAALSQTMMDQFYNTWKHDPQVVDKWISMQACHDAPDTIQHMRNMLQHPSVDLTNPNNVRALIRTFIRSNPKHYHAADGSGYAFAADVCLQIDKVNAPIAADIVHAMVLTNNLDLQRKLLLRSELERLQAGGVSAPVGEIVSKALAQLPKPNINASATSGTRMRNHRLNKLIEESKAFKEDIECYPSDAGTTNSKCYVTQFNVQKSATEAKPQPRRSKRLANKI